MSDDIESLETLEGDAKIILEAQIRFKACEEWEQTAWTLYEEDIKFAEADSDNGYQWPAVVSSQRGERPSLTINKVRQHNLQIINDAKMNKPGIKYRAVGDGASAEGAQVFEGIARHIEYISNAQTAYDTATSFQVKGGIGYARVITDYEHEETFNQEIYIRPINNPKDVRLDPDIQEKDGSDARFGFIFRDVPTEVFNREYPKYKDYASASALGNENDWIAENHVRVAEYYRRTEKEDILYAIPNKKTGEIDYIRKSDIPKEVLKFIIDTQGRPEERPICDYSIEWFFIVGNTIADRKPWSGKYIPIARLIGEETIIQGIMDRKGHTRALKDAQRMYNYNASAAVEYGALQTKAPWIAPAAAIEGYETYWDSMNDINYSVAPYNHIDDQGNPIPMPERTPTPAASQLYLEAMQTADNQMMMASGQYEANLGRKSNEVSGKAIDAREHQGDQATQHYNDNQAIFIRYIGKIILDLIPKIYDVERVKKIMAEDGEQSDVTIDPAANQAHQVQEAKTEEEEDKIIFNPNVGKYDVVVDSAPSYLTRRLETYNALSQIISNNEHAFMLLGDMWAKNSDFAEADKVAERLERMVPEQAKGGPTRETQALQQQVHVLSTELAKTIQELAGERLKVKGKDADKSVEMFNAITKRLAEIEKHVVSPKDNAKMLHDMMINEHESSLEMTKAEHAEEINPEEPKSKNE